MIEWENCRFEKYYISQVLTGLYLILNYRAYIAIQTQDGYNGHHFSLFTQENMDTPLPKILLSCVALSLAACVCLSSVCIVAAFLLLR